MLDWEEEKDPEIASTLRRAWIYRKMADDLRAQAAEAIYQRDNPDSKPGGPSCAYPYCPCKTSGPCITKEMHE